MCLGELRKAYRTEHKLSMDAFAGKSGLSKGYISMLEKNYNPKTKAPIIPSIDTFQKVSTAINVPFEELIRIVDKDQLINLSSNGTNTDQWQPTLTEKDQRDIAKEVENLLDGLDSRTALSFDGEAIDDTTKELLRKSLENTLETARLVAKEKYTPNKYRK